MTWTSTRSVVVDKLFVFCRGLFRRTNLSACVFINTTVHTRITTTCWWLLQCVHMVWLIKTDERFQIHGWLFITFQSTREWFQFICYTQLSLLDWNSIWPVLSTSYIPGPSCSKLGLDNQGLVQDLNSDLKA